MDTYTEKDLDDVLRVAIHYHPNAMKVLCLNPDIMGNLDSWKKKIIC